MAEARRRDVKLDEVDEGRASADVQKVYGEIKDVLRTNVVSSVWRRFATKPSFLTAVWNQLQPAVDQGFLEAADGIRALAIERVGEAQKVADHRPFLGDDLARAVDELGPFLDVNPKTLILICALRRSWKGQPAGGAREATEAERGVPRWQGDPTFGSDRGVKEVFTEMIDVMDLPAPNDDYRVLAKWPDYLRDAWADLRSFVGNEAWFRASVTVDWVAEHVALGLPSRVDISPSSAADLGLNEQDVEEVGRWIETFHGILPGLIVNTSFLWIGLFGGRHELPAPRAEIQGGDEARPGPTVEGTPGSAR
ncbi:MAG TPA: halocarboxylic acid dehydrogenase DehI family protein [Actinomycetota bacterium]